MRNRSILVFLSVIALTTPSMAADVYKTVDEDGNVTFTDSPPKDKPAEKIKLKETNTQPPVEFRSRRGSDGREGPEEETGPYNPRIVSPPNEYQMGPREASLSITVETDRPLDDGHSFQLFVNGAAHAEPTQSSSLTLTNVRRGRKDITVSVVDAEGAVIASSNPISVYVIRPNPKPLM